MLTLHAGRSVFPSSPWPDHRKARNANTRRPEHMALPSHSMPFAPSKQVATYLKEPLWPVTIAASTSSSRPQPASCRSQENVHAHVERDAGQSASDSAQTVASDSTLETFNVRLNERKHEVTLNLAACTTTDELRLAFIQKLGMTSKLSGSADYRVTAVNDDGVPIMCAAHSTVLACARVLNSTFTSRYVYATPQPCCDHARRDLDPAHPALALAH